MSAVCSRDIVGFECGDKQPVVSDSGDFSCTGFGSTLITCLDPTDTTYQQIGCL